MIEILRAHRASFVDELTARVTSIPQYALVDGAELRRNIDTLVGDLFVLIEEGDSAKIKGRFAKMAQLRIEQGFAPADFLQAVLLAAPTLREVLPPGTASEGILGVERTLHEVAVIAATVYADTMGRRLRAKNEELNRLNLRLVAQEKLLSIEAMGTSRALETANEFNRRVIESLNSGLMVVDTALRVTMFTSRAEEILGIPAEKALGREVKEALAELLGVDVKGIVATVRSLDRLPLTKFHFTLPDGRRRSIYARAQRMFDTSSVPLGTVVVFDDITELEERREPSPPAAPAPDQGAQKPRAP